MKEPTCQYCGKIMIETGFKRDNMNIPILLWSCRSGSCPNYGNPQITAPTTNEVEV